MVCQVVNRLRSLRPPDTLSTNRFLLVRPRSRYSVTRMLRAALRDIVRAIGITTRIVPHQFRHSYGTEMLRAGVSFAAVMKLLGHKSPHMTMEYLEITQRISSVSFNWRAHNLAISLRSRSLRLPPALASRVASIPCLPPNIRLSCSVVRCRTALLATASDASKTGSPSSSPCCASSTYPKNGHGLAS